MQEDHKAHFITTQEFSLIYAIPYSGEVNIKFPITKYNTVNTLMYFDLCLAGATDNQPHAITVRKKYTLNSCF